MSLYRSATSQNSTMNLCRSATSPVKFQISNTTLCRSARDQFYQPTLIVIRDTIESLQCLQITWVHRTFSHLQSKITETEPPAVILESQNLQSSSKSRLNLYIRILTAKPNPTQNHSVTLKPSPQRLAYKQSLP